MRSRRRRCARPSTMAGARRRTTPRRVIAAVQPGGRSTLDAVERGLELPQGALFASRDILARYGNMSSSTLMFVLSELIGRPDVAKGVALAFGPGLAAERFHFERAS